jgi:hypothetical protein
MLFLIKRAISRLKGDKLVDICEAKEVKAIEKALTTFFDGLRELDPETHKDGKDIAKI